MSIASTEFVHLHVQQYSLADGLFKVKDLVGRRQQLMPAVALTDRNNLFALVKFLACMGRGV